MESGFRESDWKLFRKLQPLALERFCQRVLDEIGRLAADADKSTHERYLAVYRLLKKRDRSLADAFNDPRRSTALVQLARIRAEELLTQEEFDRFSDGVRTSVQGLLDIWRG
jgi:hypothetical protein